MTLPIYKREFDIFLSYAHKDDPFVIELDQWLTEKAGLSVWYDQREFSGGSFLATGLQLAIERCKGILLVATDESLKSGWVKNEYNSAMDERANQEGFRVVALRIGNLDVTSLMRGATWIDVPNTNLNEDIAFSILRAFYPGEKRPNPITARDVYISCSWRQDDGISARAVCRTLVEQGFRLIGDSKDQKGFGEGNRVQRIISSCGAFVGIVPFRGVGVVIPDKSPYKYFLREIDYAMQIGLPTVIISDPRVEPNNGSDIESEWLGMETNCNEPPLFVISALENLWDQWKKPPDYQYIFCAMNLDSSAIRATGPVRQLIERVTGMRTIVGNEIDEQPINSTIMKTICNAFIVLADITDDNVNACIEAGMGLAVGTNVQLIAHGKPRKPPFMLRSLQMSTYLDEVERIGILRKIIHPYRRRIINAEL